MVSILHMRKRMLGELAYLTRAGPHLTSVTEEVQSWEAWPIFLKRAWTFPATWMLSYTLRGLYAGGVGLPPCLACHFSGKLMFEGAKTWVQAHPGLALLACDLCCPWDFKLSRPPTSTLPVLKFLICFK